MGNSTHGPPPSPPPVRGDPPPRRGHRRRLRLQAAHPAAAGGVPPSGSRGAKGPLRRGAAPVRERPRRRHAGAPGAPRRGGDRRRLVQGWQVRGGGGGVHQAPRHPLGRRDRGLPELPARHVLLPADRHGRPRPGAHPPGALPVHGPDQSLPGERPATGGARKGGGVQRLPRPARAVRGPLLPRPGQLRGGEAALYPRPHPVRRDGGGSRPPPRPLPGGGRPWRSSGGAGGCRSPAPRLPRRRGHPDPRRRPGAGRDPPRVGDHGRAGAPHG